MVVIRCCKTWLAGNSPYMAGGLNGNSSMDRGCSIAVFDYQRVVIVKV
jgi:hypothetical protein